MTKKSPKPKSPGNRQTYTSTISQPFLSETILSAFSQDGKFFALVTLAVDKHRLRIFNGISGRATAECTIPSGRVSSLVWSTLSVDADEHSSPSDRKSTRLLQSHLNLVCRLLLEKKNPLQARCVFIGSPSSTGHRHE